MEFAECWPERVEFGLNGMQVPFIGREHLIVNKRSSGRPQDVADAAALADD